MQDVSEQGAMWGEPGSLIFRKAVPPHGRSHAGGLGCVFPLFPFFFCACLTLMTKLVLRKEETSARAGALSLPLGCVCCLLWQWGQGAAG